MIVIINLKLNSGFFKTEDYTLLIEKNRLVMSSDKDKNIYVLKDDISGLNLIIKEFDAINLEIFTKEKVYTGRLDKVTNVEKCIRYFKDEFGDKFKVEVN